jgi:hypothetical protein
MKLLSLLLAALFALPINAGQLEDKAKMSAAHKHTSDASLALYATLPGTNGEKDVTHFLCTTTVIDKTNDTYKLLTAGHCVTGDGLPENLKFFVTEDIADNPVLQPVTVVRAENGSKYDFAILELKSAKEYPVVKVAVRVPEVEDKVYDVNFSLGIGKQVALGVVATDVLPTEGSEKDCDICKGRYMVHIFAAGGASGSAIVDEKTNEIVGVGEFGFPSNTMGLGCETTTSLAEWLTLPSPKASAA